MKLNIFVHWRMYNWESKPEYAVHTHSMESNPDYHVLGEMEIDVPFELPTPAQVTLSRIAGFRAEQGRLTAQITKIDDQIQQLQCIEHKPEPVA